MCSPYWNTTSVIKINKYYDRALIQRHDYEPRNYDPRTYNIKPIDIPLWENIFYITGSIVSCILIYIIINDIVNKKIEKSYNNIFSQWL